MINLSDFHHQVQATHKYEAEDDDELSFEKNEIIHVIPFEDPEEQVSMLVLHFVPLAVSMPVLPLAVSMPILPLAVSMYVN